MMDTPICDFVKAYREKNGLRMHMPGHKGRGFLGMEEMDITEIAGADELYHARGIIQKSEENASSLFGTKKTVYSAEGSSLCIRAMLYLALLHGKAMGRRPMILAGRNAHRTLMYAAAMLDAEIEWMYPAAEESLISCRMDGADLQKKLEGMAQMPAAVYVTTPDYLGNCLDVGDLARVCRQYDVPLLVDNAHGAYLKFLPEDCHPMTLGADLCCDSAHKTLPVLTGGAYLHIGRNAPDLFQEQTEKAMALFASTSPSYLILQSLDAANPYLADEYRKELAIMAGNVAQIKNRLAAHGYELAGDEPGKLTIAPKAYGYTGDELHDLLRAQGIECEFSDPDYLVMMPTPALDAAALEWTEKILLGIPRRQAYLSAPPPVPMPQRVISIRQAMLSLQEEIPVEKAAGRILADAHVGCPPCIPIIAAGERIDQAAMACFCYYGVESCSVVLEK